MNNLEKARQQINGIDKQMAQLFEQRMQAVALVAKEKGKQGLPILNASREAQVVENNIGFIKDQTVKEFYVNFIKNTMEVSKNYQRRLLNGYKVAYCGVEGAFAHIAAKNVFPYGEYIAKKSFEEAYKAVENGECDTAILPIENSFAGDVQSVMDLSFFGSLYITGIYEQEITQNLLALKGANKQGIKKVISHIQALTQCSEYIKQMGFKEEQAYNTAAAAKAVKQTGDVTLAAIGSEETAKIYGLEVIERAINKSNKNTTRFAVFSRVKAQNTNRFLMFFRVKDEAGALSKAIEVIGKKGFNMQNIKSHPTKDHAFNYYFFVECSGNVNSENGKQLIKELNAICTDLKITEAVEIK